MVTISIAQFDKLIEYMKMVRSDYIVFYNNTMIGFDKRLCVFKTIDSVENIIDYNITFMVSYNAIIDFRKQIDGSEDIVFDNNIIYTSSLNYIYNESVPFNLSEIYNKYLELKYRLDTNSKSFGSLRGLDFIEKFLASKTSDGAIGIRVDEKHLMYIPSNILPVNKSDDLLLSIHDDIMYFLSMFTIVKKKKVFINVYVKFLTLC